MTTTHKRGIEEDRERAASTKPVQKWWVGVGLWITVALLIGVGYRFVAPGPENYESAPDRLGALHHALMVIFNVVVMYGISYYAARQTLARRSLREIWNSESNQTALNRMGLPVFLSVGALAIIIGAGQPMGSLFEGLLAVSTVFSIYRALTTAYTAHYFDYVVSPQESREFTNDNIIKGKKRRVMERMAVTAGVYYPRHRLIFPLVQTIFVAFGIQALVNIAWALLALPTDGAEAFWVSLVAPIFPVISVVLWGLWHLHGGLGRILRISSGRSMKSFGWQHPELL